MKIGDLLKRNGNRQNNGNNTTMPVVPEREYMEIEIVEKGTIPREQMQSMNVINRQKAGATAQMYKNFGKNLAVFGESWLSAVHVTTVAKLWLLLMVVTGIGIGYYTFTAALTSVQFTMALLFSASAWALVVVKIRDYSMYKHYLDERTSRRIIGLE